MFKKLRRQIMRGVTTGFASLTFYSASRLFVQDKKNSLPKVGGNLFGLYLLGKMLLSLIPEYLSYYKKDFHPHDIDYTDIVNDWKKILAEDYAMPSFAEDAAALQAHPVAAPVGKATLRYS